MLVRPRAYVQVRAMPRRKCFCYSFSCPTKDSDAYEQDLEDMLSKNGLHKSMIAKKFHEIRHDVTLPSIIHANSRNPAAKNARSPSPATTSRSTHIFKGKFSDQSPKRTGGVCK